MTRDIRYDAIGIGIGPFNLSAAALCEPIDGLATVFLDRSKEFSWHPGLLISGSTIQTSHLKDLVTLADPCSRHSFLSYLHAHHRMYRFITADFEGVERAEFNDYFRWVARRLSNLRFGYSVEKVDHDGSRFIINDDPELTSRNLILGTGLRPTIPPGVAPHLGEHVFHGHSLLTRGLEWARARIAVIGGGQSGAEVLNLLLSDERRLPSVVHWVTSRANFLPLDDSPFTNELFTPGYSNHFFELPKEARMFCLESQKLASDGIAQLLQDLYRKIYSFDFLRVQRPEISLRPHTKLVDMRRRDDGYAARVQHALSGDEHEIVADIIVLCTGYHYQVPAFLDPLLPRIHLNDGAYEVNRDFSIRWDGRADHKIYVQNAAINARGIADPNLSLMAWRSANIVNDLARRPVYHVQDSKDLKLWA